MYINFELSNVNRPSPNYKTKPSVNHLFCYRLNLFKIYFYLFAFNS